MKLPLKRLRAKWSLSGQTTVIFALMLPVVIGILGLGVDAAHIFNTRRDVQAAADLAALAGASQLPADLGAASTVATDIAGENGFSADNVTVTAGYGDNDNQIEVVIDEEIDLFFMPALGISTVNVSARSVASHEINAGTAILAKKDYHCWEGTVTFRSYNVTIDGRVHSNGGLDLRNSGNNVVTDKLTYKVGMPIYPHDNMTSCLHDVYPKPDPNIMNPDIEIESASWHDWPMMFSVNDFDCDWDVGVTGGDIHDDADWWVGGSMDAARQLKPGVYCLSGNGYLDLLNADDVKGNVTLIGRHIRISGEDMELTAYENGVLLFAGSTDFPAMTLEPDGGTWEGLIYNRCETDCGASWLEGGQIVFNASGGFRQIGSVVAWAVHIAGSNWSLFGTDNATYEPMRLVE